MKILGSDYDGTFTHGGVGEEKLAAVKRWRESGNIFGIISGRGRDFLPELLGYHPGLELDFLASCNGAYIMDGGGNLISETRCENVPLRPFLDDLAEWGCRHAHINADRYICAAATADDRPSYVAPEKVCLFDELPQFDYFNQISVRRTTTAEAAEAVECIRKKYGEFLNPLQNGICIDIVPAGMNKAQGLYRVMEHFGASYEDVIAIGDNINDTDMIREFRSYAMANGVESIRAMADAIVRDVTELMERESV